MSRKQLEELAFSVLTEIFLTIILGLALVGAVLKINITVAVPRSMNVAPFTSALHPVVRALWSLYLSSAFLAGPR